MHICDLLKGFNICDEICVANGYLQQQIQHWLPAHDPIFTWSLSCLVIYEWILRNMYVCMCVLEYLHVCDWFVWIHSWVLEEKTSQSCSVHFVLSAKHLKSAAESITSGIWPWWKLHNVWESVNRRDHFLEKCWQQFPSTGSHSVIMRIYGIRESVTMFLHPWYSCYFLRLLLWSSLLLNN